MGATRAKDANGTDFDHRNNVRRALEPLGVSGGNWFWLDGSQVPTFGLGGFKCNNYLMLIPNSHVNLQNYQIVTKKGPSQGKSSDIINLKIWSALYIPLLANP